MTYEAKLNEFWSSFGLTAYASTAVPEDVTFPYLVYENVYPENMEKAAGVINVYYYSDSEAVPNAKAREIREAIGDGGKLLSFDDGHIWIMLGSPEQINLVLASNNNVKQRQINITYEVHRK